MLKNWTPFEKLFFILGTLSAFIATVLFGGSWLTIGYTLQYFWTALLLAKGKYACYIIGIISTFFYAVVSYMQAYYGEVIISMFCTLPLMIYGLVNWMNHQDKTSTVIIKEVSKNEIRNLLLGQILVFVIFYLLLKSLNTSNLIVSTISVIASTVATYLTARRSEYGFVGYIINDIILILLWGIPVIQGSLFIIPILLCPILLLINDVYGVYNWKRIKKQQRKETIS